MKKRILSLLLCCCFLAGAFRPTQAHAIAGVDDAALLAAGGVALVGSLLVAGGAAFKSNDDLQAVASDIYDRYIKPSSALLGEVTTLVRAWYKGVGSGVVCCANISTRLWNAVCGDPVAENVASGYYGTASKGFSAGGRFVRLCNYSNYYVVPLTGLGTTFSVDVPGTLLTFPSGYSLRVTRRDSTSNYFCLYNAAGNYVRRQSQLLGRTCSLAIVDDYLYFVSEMPDNYDSTKYYGSVQVGVGEKLSVLGLSASDLSQTLNYPTDKDLIRPGEKSAVVQLPSDLPRYGEDGTTVEMPVLGLTQEDYLITGSDVLSPDKVDEDVILDAKTGTKVGESSGEITEPTTPVAGNILDWLKNILKGLLDAIIALLTAIRDGILSIPQAIAKAIAAVFTPSAEATASLQGIAAEHLPIAADLADISKRVVSTIESPSGSGGLGYTLSVDLGKHVGGGWSDTVITLLDVSWYKPYKPLVDDTIVGLAWLLFLWNLYGALPSIIHGMASGLNVTSRIDDKGGFGL